MPARMNKQYIAVLHVSALLNIFWCKKPNVIQHVTQVNDHTRAVAPLNRDLVNRLAFGHKMTRCIEMCAHVIRRLNILRVDAMLRFALDVFHFKRWIKRPERTILIEVLRKVVDFHWFLLYLSIFASL